MIAAQTLRVWLPSSRRLSPPPLRPLASKNLKTSTTHDSALVLWTITHIVCYFALPFMLTNERPSCSIIGFGRFGRLLASILMDEFSLVVHDTDRSAMAAAAAQRIRVVDLEQACQAENIFFCVPISTFESILRQARPHLQPNTLVMDTCSVKLHPARLMQQLCPETVELLATHPLFGPDSATAGLAGLRIVFCPLRIAAARLHGWQEFWQRRGVQVITKSPDEHDRLAAYSQGITHLLGRVLGELQLSPSDISTKGFEAILGVIEQTNHDTWQLFHDLQRYNPYTKQMRDDLVKAFNTIVGRLDLRS
ncbi:MAG: prephenate dehydrogenase/arogenate dehydrogenase family protein [Acidobacteriota bacterium]|nr:prephenate dehydrogenase/arogenate dehydrogenase family protein [Blastocatellia bacterium]MDW8238632.1 prephenate dehydrogenase/arogenate dehydrogenase family protein [Acidobacteriota bacterium]